MKWFRGDSRPRELHEGVRIALESQFHLDPQLVSRLRLLEQRGQYQGRDVRYIKILDPTLLSEDRASQVKQYGDLVRGEKALVFEGHIERDGSVYLADRRPPRPFASFVSRT